MPGFTISEWRAWSPGLNLASDRFIEAADSVMPGNMPKLLQRRLSPLAKAVFNVAASCLSDCRTMPVVFSSAHGEICKSLALLQTIQAGEELSPTAFSLSVHNAIAGLFSIAFNIRQELTVLAPCGEGIAPAVVEAAGMLAEGADEALVLLYDEPIAAFYPIAPYKLNCTQPCVLGLRIARYGHGINLQINRARECNDDGEQPAQLLTFIRFLLSDENELLLGNPGHSWIWRKH